MMSWAASPPTDAAIMADADFVVEAILEEIDAKKNLFEQLEAVCGPEGYLPPTPRPYP